MIEPRRTAASTPSGNPISKAISSASTVSSRVIGIRCPSVCDTLKPLRGEVPKFPVTACRSQVTYWTGSGLSRPYCLLIAASTRGSLVSADSATAGPPGSARMPMKTTIDAMNSVTTEAPKRRSRYHFTSAPPSAPGQLWSAGGSNSSAEACGLQPHQTIPEV
jgi:hypothetical protein